MCGSSLVYMTVYPRLLGTVEHKLAKIKSKTVAVNVVGKLAKSVCGSKRGTNSMSRLQAKHAC